MDELTVILASSVMKIFIVLAPFVAIYTLNKRFERETKEKPRSVYFIIGLLFCLINVVGVIISRALNLFGGAPSAFGVFAPIFYLSLIVGSLLLYWFVLLVKEYQTRENAYKKFTEMLPLLLVFSAFFIGMVWGIHLQHNLSWVLLRYSYLGYIILALCYLESGSFLKILR